MCLQVHTKKPSSCLSHISLPTLSLSLRSELICKWEHIYLEQVRATPSSQNPLLNHPLPLKISEVKCFPWLRALRCPRCTHVSVSCTLHRRDAWKVAARVWSLVSSWRRRERPSSRQMWHSQQVSVSLLKQVLLKANRDFIVFIYFFIFLFKSAP